MSEQAGPPATSDVLAGTRWRIQRIDGEALLEGVALDVEFGHDGRVSGSTGVNRFTASYTVAGSFVTIGPMATTRRAADPPLMEQEQRVVAALAGMCPFEVSRDELALDGPMGWVELVTTDPRPPAPPVDPAPTAAEPPPRRERPGPSDRRTRPPRREPEVRPEG